MNVRAGAIGNDEVIMAAAARHGGVCTRRDLLTRGVEKTAIDHRVGRGLLRPTVRGVYVIDALADRSTPLHHAVAALPGAVLSRFTAARLHGFPIGPAVDPPHVDVVMPHGTGRREIEGVRVHRRRRPSARSDRTVIDGLPVTGPALTLVDLAAVVGPSRLAQLVHTQIGDDHPALDELVACFDSVARRGVDGVAAMRVVLAPLVDGAPVKRSVLERAVAQLLADNEIEGFEQQVSPPWYDGRRGVVDFAHRELRIVLEADGRRWHRREQDMTEDRRRDRLAARHGWAAIRVTWAEISGRPDATVADIAAIVAARRRQLTFVA